MFNVLTALAMGIVVFAITIGVGMVVLNKFGSAVASCSTGYTYNDTVNPAVCSNATGNHVPATASITTGYLTNEMGTTGLAGWTAAIVALAIGLLFIGALMGKRKG